jgi:hypothetical protein
MNQEIKQKWIEALKSDEYRQGKLALKNYDDTFCCLGVLCDLYIKEKGLKWTAPIEGSQGYYTLCTETDRARTHLPDEVVTWADMDSRYGSYVEGSSLMADNDNGKSFLEIANIIRENF